MKPKTVKRREERVELIGVPHYFQGAADALCGYYTMSMMLAALYPALGATIHDDPLDPQNGSPVFRALRSVYRGKTEFNQKVAEWVFRGLPVTEATYLLNEVAQQLDPSPAQHFIQWRVRARRLVRYKRGISRASVEQVMNVNDVLHAISKHLPVIVARGGLGSHAVLAVGYQTRGASDRAICIHDPSSVRPEWRATGNVFVADAQIVLPNLGLFLDYRPGKVEVSNGEVIFETWQSQ